MDPLAALGGTDEAVHTDTEMLLNKVQRGGSVEHAANVGEEAMCSGVPIPTAAQPEGCCQQQLSGHPWGLDG